MEYCFLTSKMRVTQDNPVLRAFLSSSWDSEPGCRWRGSKEALALAAGRPGPQHPAPSPTAARRPLPPGPPIAASQLRPLAPTRYYAQQLQQGPGGPGGSSFPLVSLPNHLSHSRAFIHLLSLTKMTSHVGGSCPCCVPSLPPGFPLRGLGVLHCS